MDLLSDPATAWLDERELALVARVEQQQADVQALTLAAARLRNLVSKQQEIERRARLRRAGESDEDVARESARLDLFQRALSTCAQRLEQGSAD